MNQGLFCIENLRVGYPHQRGTGAQWAVDGVCLRLDAGQRLGLVGESGCGKSTLGRAAMRLLPPATKIEGRVLFNGESVFDFSPAQLRKFRGEAVALVFQDPMTRLDPLMTIGDHCLETLLCHKPQLSKKQAKEKAIETLEAVRIPAARWGQYPHEFSGGMRQRVAIALALLLEPKMIVADEPTTSLDVTVSAEICQELTRLCKERNLGLLMISHDLAMIGEYCDEIAVMYGGKVVEKGEAKQVLAQPQHEYTQSLLKAALHIQAIDDGVVELAKNSADSGLVEMDDQQSPLLRVVELKQHYSLETNLIERVFSGKENQTIKAVDGVNLELYPGEILGLVGESGCGKSTLSRTILQLIKATSGKVEFLGKDLTQLDKNEVRKMRRFMQMVFQDPHACLNPMMTVGESIADPLLIHKMATPAEAKKQVMEMLERVGLTPSEFYDRYPSELSGGQQQRVAIARALITRPQLVICDEPVSMLDASVQSQVLDLMQSLKREFELTYLFITHDLWVARFLCDRIAVMNGGQIVEIKATREIFGNPQHPYTQKLLQAAPLLARTS